MKHNNKSTNPETSKNTYIVLLVAIIKVLCITCSNYQYHSQGPSKTSSTSEQISHSLRSEVLCGMEFLSSYIFTMVSNFESRSVNGNRSSKGIKIAHWNKGNSHLVNKMAEIKNIIGTHHPHILGVSEANLLDKHDQSLVAIPDFNLHVCPTISNPSLGNSRVVVYTHKDIVKVD